MTVHRGTSNTNVRGGAPARRARKLWLLREFGDGITAPCRAEVHHETCPGTVTIETLSVDRWPVLGRDGGTYRRNNIRPAWGLCNSKHGGTLAARPMTNGHQR